MWSKLTCSIQQYSFTESDCISKVSWRHIDKNISISHSGPIVFRVYCENYIFIHVEKWTLKNKTKQNKEKKKKTELKHVFVFSGKQNKLKKELLSGVNVALCSCKKPGS